MSAVCSKTKIRSFRKTIYAHYRAHGRHALPWRKTTNPYRILVSEIMLQQTQVSRVKEKYSLFLKKFPTAKALAAAPLKAVMAAWSGMGYNRRALALKRAAKIIVAEYNGKIPDTFDALVALPGVGESSAGGVLAFAYNIPWPYVETNIRTAFIHFFFKNRNNVTDNELRPLIEQALDRKNPRLWYSALMDYGVMLKSKYPNPSRRSAHHIVQSRFEGSDRQARGMIIRALSRKNMDVDMLQKATGLLTGKLLRNLVRLLKEGLVQKNHGSYGIA